MLNLYKMLFFSVAFVTLLIGFVTINQDPMRRSRMSSSRNPCINNLKQLEGAKATWALEGKRRTNDVPAWSDIIGETKYISRKPVCPLEGSYTLGTVGDATICTIPGHVLP